MSTCKFRRLKLEHLPPGRKIYLENDNHIRNEECSSFCLKMSQRRGLADSSNQLACTRHMRQLKNKSIHTGHIRSRPNYPSIHYRVSMALCYRLRFQQDPFTKFIPFRHGNSSLIYKYLVVPIWYQYLTVPTINCLILKYRLFSLEPFWHR